ncbi:MAG TPA: hypothetical protein VE129_12400, partial [Thermoanaerobaculia bacterium]|nr:hypothetical protein [Thermoanaerobaculia bacterium]
PFPLPVRVLIAFGYFLSFEYSVIARGYVLVVLGLFLLASRDGPPTWVDGLLLAMVANATAHGFLLAGTVFAVRFRELPRAARIVAGLGLCFVGWQLWPPPDGQMEPFEFLRNVAYLPRFAPLALFPDHDSRPFQVAGVVMMVLAALTLYRRPRSLALLLLGWGALYSFFVFVYVTGLRHVGLLALWLVFVLWEDRVRGTGPSPALPIQWAFRFSVALSLAISLATAIRTWRIERTSSFSEGSVMASFLRDRGLALAPIAAHGAPHCESVLAYLPPRMFWYPGIRAYGSYMKWDAAYALGGRLAPRVAAQRVRAAFSRDQWPLLLFNEELTDPESLGFRLLFSTPGNISQHRLPHTDERFFLYEPLPAEEATGPSLPRAAATAPPR